MTDYIAYYRVSTDKQGVKGLGMDAQREAVSKFIAGRGSLVSEYTEVESGRKHRNRPQLLAALDECRSRRAVLLIARLDRLARNVAFISNLMDRSDVDFIAVDMPEANRLTIHILAAVAEHERELISKRTKDALAIARQRGQRLGNPQAREMIATAREAKAIQPPAPEVLALMQERRAQGRSYRQIAGELNRLNIRTGQGAQWYASTTRAALRRAAA